MLYRAIMNTSSGSSYSSGGFNYASGSSGYSLGGSGYVSGGTGSGSAGVGSATGALGATQNTAMSEAQFLNAAYKAGFLADAWQRDIRTEEILALVARAYAVRAGVKVDVSVSASASSSYTFVISGLADAPEPVRSYAQFAIDNGIATPVMSGSSFPAGRAATRAEVVVFIYQALEMLGEI